MQKPDSIADSIVLTIETERMRLDRALLDALAAQPESPIDQQPSRTRLQAMIVEGAVQVDGAVITDPATIVKAGQVCMLSQRMQPSSPVAASLDPEQMQLDILFEDADLIVLNKPAGLVTHPGPGHSHGTLVHGLLYHCGPALSTMGGQTRPGIVHRLDRDTSGLMVIAKTDFAHRTLSAGFAAYAEGLAAEQNCPSKSPPEERRKTISRSYLALVRGHIHPRHGEIDAPISRSPANRKKMTVHPTGRRAVTRYKTLLAWGNPDRRPRQKGDCSLLQCDLQTGRTHQIRVHMAHLGHGVVGDPLYGKPAHGVQFPRQALHAAELRLLHPRSGETLVFSAPLPSDFSTLIRCFGPAIGPISPHSRAGEQLNLSAILPEASDEPSCQT